MGINRIEEIRELLRKSGKVYVNDLSARFNVSEVSVRKYLTKLEEEGAVTRFYGGAALIEREEHQEQGIYSDQLLYNLASEARGQITDGDSVFIGSGRTCCVLARQLSGFNNLTVVTNNISAMPDLIKNVSRVYMVGGEATSTDNQTYFSSWESPELLLGNIFVNKAFTSISGLDLKAGLTVDSIISTYIFKQLPVMTDRWYLLADSTKFDKISIYQVAELRKIHTLVTDTIPQNYSEYLAGQGVNVIQIGLQQ